MTAAAGFSSLALLLAACATAASPVEAGEWIITAVDGRPAAGTLSFAQGRLGAYVGCNRMSGAYRLTGNKIEVAALEQTQIYCEAESPGAVPLMQIEATVGAILMADPTISVEGDGRMMLTSAAGSLGLRRR